MVPHPIGTVLIKNENIDYEDIGFSPDFKVDSFDELTILEQRTGYFSEVCSTILSNGRNYSSSGMFYFFEMNRNNTKIDIIAGGRYFNSKHECFNSHQLSHRINKSKRDQTQNNIFSGIYSPIINKELYRIR